MRSAVSSNDWKVWCQFFFKHRNQLFCKSISNKPRCRANKDSEERVLCYLEYTNAEIILVPNQAFVFVSKQKSLEILCTIHRMTKDESHYHFIKCHQWLLFEVLLIVSYPKPSEPTKLIQCCLIFNTTRAVHLNTDKLTTGPNLWQEFEFGTQLDMREESYQFHTELGYEENRWINSLLNQLWLRKITPRNLRWCQKTARNFTRRI